MTEEAPDLKPCPFCGGSANLRPILANPARGSWSIFWTSCERCSAEGPTADTRADAAERWNARVVPA